MLRRLAHANLAKAVSQNLDRVTRFVSADVMLTLVVAARENANSIGAVSMQRIDTWHEGGLDFLYKEKDKLGLPASITNTWQKVTPFVSQETHRMVYTAEIPARDQVIAYAAQLNASMHNTFNRHRQWAKGKYIVPASGSRVAMLFWKAYAFLAPGGPAFDEKKSFDSQLGQKFGCFTAITYLSITPPPPAQRGINLFDRAFADTQLNKSEWVRIAKALVAETLSLERLLNTTRELRPY